MSPKAHCERCWALETVTGEVQVKLTSLVVQNDWRGCLVCSETQVGFFEQSLEPNQVLQVDLHSALFVKAMVERAVSAVGYSLERQQGSLASPNGLLDQTELVVVRKSARDFQPHETGHLRAT